MYYDSVNDRIGIGAIDPLSTLTVSGISRFIRANYYLLLNPNYGNSNVFGQIQSQIDLAFATNGDNNRMYITSSGYVGIGTSTPDRPLYVLSTSNNIGIYSYNTQAGASNSAIMGKVSGAGTNNYAMQGYNTAVGTSNYAVHANAEGAGTTNYGIWAQAVNASTNYAGYFVGNVYCTANVSALSFTDRTPWYEGDALSEIATISGTDGQIDHTSLPEFVLTTASGENGIEYLRDIGNMVSMLTVAVQQLLTRIELLESK
jgi:hypothetical protein